MAIIEKLKKKVSRGDVVESKDAGAAVLPKSTEQAGKNLSEEEKVALALVVKKPRVTEKTTTLQGIGVYTFNVSSTATRQQIRSAIERLYAVHVVRIHTVHIPRKKRMRGRLEGWKKGYKKAMVKIKEGQTIEMQ